MPSYCYMKGHVLSSISHANIVYGGCFFLSYLHFIYFEETIAMNYISV
jgi:hypothetical protein